MYEKFAAAQAALEAKTTNRLIGLQLAADNGGPGDMKPDYNYLPVNNTIRSIVQGLQGTAIYVLVGLLVAAGLCWAAGHFSSSQTATKVGYGVMIVCLVAAAIVAGAGVAIQWATGIQIFGSAA